MESKDGSAGSWDGCFPVVPHVNAIHQMYLEGMPAWRISRETGLHHGSVTRLISIFKRLGHAPSQERLCVCVLNHPDIDDSQIADLFGRNERWVADVRRRKWSIRAREEFPLHWEYIDEGLAPADPSPEEIAVLTSSIRSNWVDGVEGRYAEDSTVTYRRVFREKGNEQAVQ